MASNTIINIAYLFVCFPAGRKATNLVIYLKKASISLSPSSIKCNMVHWKNKSQGLKGKNEENIFFAERRGQLREKE